MRKPILVPCLTAALLLGITPCHATFKSGNDLYEACTSQNPIEYTSCLGYLEGASDVYEERLAVAASMAKRPFKPCVPVTVTAGQLERVVVTYMKAHPENLGDLAATQVIEAIVGAWCPTKRRR